MLLRRHKAQQVAEKPAVKPVVEKEEKQQVKKTRKTKGE